MIVGCDYCINETISGCTLAKTWYFLDVGLGKYLAKNC